jgi:raffinose/stachyose/melibiose transport system permease protein
MRRSGLFTYSTLTVMSTLAVLPIIAIVFVALGKNQIGTTVSLHDGFTFDNFTRAWHVGAFGSALVTSMIVATATTLCATFLSILAGFAFGVLRFPAQTLLFYLFMLGIIFPVESYIIPLFYQLQGYSLINTYLGLILPETAFAVAFGAFWMRATFRSMPRSIIEAARIDGARTWAILWRILLAPARPGILTLMVLTFVWTWNDFLLPLVVASGGSLQTAPLGLAFFAGQRLTDYPGLAAGALIISAPVILVFVALQRQFFQGVFAGATKG